MSPFIPFTIIFCNIVERTDPSDLEYLGHFASVFESVSQLPRFALHARQATIFTLLYEVAAKYIAVRSKPYDGEAQQTTMAAFDFKAYSNSFFSNDVCTDLPPLALPAWNAESQPSQGHLTPFADAGRQGESGESEAATVDADSFQANLEGAQLSDWFYQSHQMMNLEDM